MKKINWRYALGETLIVIIGITIAFSLNKYSERLKDRDLRAAYLTNLKNDIQTDKKTLENNLQTLTDFQKSTNEIIPHLNTDSPQKMSIIRKVFQISNLVEFVPQDVTYNTLINSGDLTLFEDLKLKSAIQKYYSADLHTILKAYERQEIIHKEYLGKYYIYHADFDKMRSNEFPFEDEKLLKRIVQSLAGSYKIQMDATEKGITQCDSIIAIFDRELH
ncbi:DUF6090 family protein [Aquimarina spongiae]|uniref:Uncharacterized protein n=1 Tax=Aquimarina spongiae TaxID=570521 RepID=A0A1M6JDG6_9FLAO|nr:DUF6090 family protein [Aquimarina spongiae]SHJ44757.1 hypothetical protein SAMN04488508_1096 [Aquimarina spongiae]